MTTLAESIEQKKEGLRESISHQAASLLEHTELVFTMLRDTPNDTYGICSCACTLIERATALRLAAARLRELADLPYTIEGHAVDDKP